MIHDTIFAVPSLDHRMKCLKTVLTRLPALPGGLLGNFWRGVLAPVELFGTFLGQPGLPKFSFLRLSPKTVLGRLLIVSGPSFIAY